MFVRAWGTFPGDDLDEALNIIAGECASNFFLPTLPQRGPTSTALAQVSALFEEIHWATGLRTFEMHTRTSPFSRAIRDRWERDWDSILEAINKYQLSGKTVTVVVPGPYTIASAVELPNGHWALTDVGAVNHLVEELSGATNRCAEILRRESGCVPVTIIDETSAGAALAGRQPGAYRFEDIPQPPSERVVSQWGKIADAAQSAGGDESSCIVRFPTEHCEWMSYLPQLDAAIGQRQQFRIAFNLRNYAAWTSSMIDAVGERTETWGSALEFLVLGGGVAGEQTARAHHLAKVLQQLGFSAPAGRLPVLHSVRDLACDTVAEATNHLRDLTRYPALVESEWDTN